MNEVDGARTKARRRPGRALLRVGAASLALFGCEAVEPVQLPKAAPFIALERDFQGYHEWLELEPKPIEQQGVTHEAGQARIWVNALPPAAAAEFPVGTTIVKQTDADASGRQRTFAMVKRGAGYNAAGSPGWEWFELRQRADETTAILWRGPDVRTGDSYRPGPDGHIDDPLGGCNGCHQMARDNDHVLTERLRLDRR